MNILLIILLMLGYAVSSVRGDEPGIDLAEWPAVTVNGNEGVIVPRNDADGMVWSEDPIEGYWLPGEEWLTRAEDAVVRESAGIPDEQRRPVLGGYRQYTGFIVNGERKISINSMCTEIEGWRSSGVMVMDGGSCFWNAVYNADTGQVESLLVNGQA